MSDQLQGIWWLMGDPPVASLSLPTLPDGWLYEGWIATADQATSTGKFARPDQVDDDGAGPTAGPDDAPAFPGQDFIDPPITLGPSFQAVITIEPDPDDSREPFPVKPLVDDSITPEPAPTSQEMANRAAATAPAGEAFLVQD